MKIFYKLVAIAILIVLIGCNSETSEKTNAGADKKTEDAEGGVLNVAYSAQPPTLDPYMTRAIATSDVMRHVFETLITFDSKYNVQPMLAESFEQSDDGKTITFYLRKGVQFHSGEEMTAEDVVASMTHWKGVPGSTAGEQFPDAVFEASDDYTVLMKLPEPLSTTLSVLAHSSGTFPAIMPKEVIENTSPEGINEYVGTGPFKFEEWKQDQYVHLTKFEDYQAREEQADGLAGKREALVDDLYFHFVTDSSTRVAGIQSGEYDVAHAVPFDTADQLESNENINNHVYPGGFLSVVFNKKAGLFTDVKAREAVLAALNMEDILKVGYTDDRHYILNHNMMMSHQTEQWNSHFGEDKYNQVNPEKAKQLLDEIGYNGEPITIITTRDYDDQYNGAVVVQEQLEQIGMDVELEVYDWATLLEKNQDETEYDIYVMGFVAVPEPSTFFYTRENYPGWTNSPELKNLISEYRGQPSLEDAKNYYEHLQEWYWDYLPIIKAGDFNRVSSTRTTVSDFQYQDGFIFWNISNNK